MFYYIYKPGQEITLSQKNFYEYIYERRSTSTSFCKWPNKSSPIFCQEKYDFDYFQNSVSSSSEILLLYGCKKVRCEGKCDNYRLSLLL